MSQTRKVLLELRAYHCNSGLPATLLILIWHLGSHPIIRIWLKACEFSLCSLHKAMFANRKFFDALLGGYL